MAAQPMPDRQASITVTPGSINPSRLLLAAAMAGAAGDALLRVGPMGLNVALWAAVLVALTLWVTRGRVVISRRDDIAGAALLLLFAAGFAWRADPVLQFLSLCGLGAVILLAAMRRPAARLAASGMLDFARGGALAAFHIATGAPLLLFKDINWKRAQGAARWGVVGLRGALLAFPFLLVFGALLMGADPVFSRLVYHQLHINLPRLLSHTLLMLFFAWIVGGFLRGILGPDSTPVNWPERPERFGAGAAELAIALGLLDALFFAFVAVQFRYLFGGTRRVMITPHLTYAQYARHGFFELTAVIALALPLLLAAHWLRRPGEAAAPGSRWFAWPAGAMAGLLFIILASALFRMRLYQLTYGLTEPRFYTTAFMVWLGLLLGWFIWTVLRERRQRFAFGALVSALAAIVILQAVNPAALVAKSDIQRALAGKKYDAGYIARLGSDAAPAIAAGLPKLPLPARCAMLQRFALDLKTQAQRPHWSDWRTWNWSRRRARKLERQALATELPASGCPPPAIGNNHAAAGN